MNPESRIGGQGQPWAVVLAGGAGVHFGPLIRRLHGEERPTQFVAVLGGPFLLRQTREPAKGTPRRRGARA